MLTLSNIHKEYASGDLKVEALKGVSLSFRQNEFVAILGPSGCGKTTLLNIIGGLDRYSQGDLIIKGRSTREYTDADWDSYRNHSVGFVFQSYNLIPHQSVLSNVELALTISGVSAKERRRRAVQALERVGLGDQLNKKPNQMSGGQMQRVAIARALVNDPEILLADEPTGALDSETSVQIMEVLKQIANDRLVVMVTHNPELAVQYATRTIRLLDGRVTDDTAPFDGADEKAAVPVRTGATSMHFTTALRLSLNNLLTKKGRTFMVALAGSIGIIGIALILSLSNGVNEYIKSVEEDTLAQYPLTIEAETMNQSALLTSVMSATTAKNVPHEEGRVYSSNVLGELMNSMVTGVNENDLPSFKEYLDNSEEIKSLTTGISYEYGSTLRIYNRSAQGGAMQVHPSTLIDTMTNSSMMSDVNALASMSSVSSLSQMTSMYNMNVFYEISQQESDNYEMLAGRMPQSYNELLLVVGENDDISDTTLYTLGLRDQSEVQQLFMTLLTGGTVDSQSVSYSYDELMNIDFALVLPGNLYREQENGLYTDAAGDASAMEQVLAEGVSLRIVGIARNSGNSLISTMMPGGIGYTHALVEYVITANNETAAVRAQREQPAVDIFTGVNFEGGVDMEPSMEMLEAYIASLPEAQQSAMRTMVGLMDEDKLMDMMRAEMAKQQTDATYEGNLALLNATSLDAPTQIKIYPIDFESKQRVVELIEQYNAQAQESGQEQKVIRYTDYVGSLMSSVTTIIDTISYVLIAFVSISLVVSSIMIGIITYISVLERTKEIGILRAMGASKRDVSRVFTAETLIIGLVAGALGVLVTWLLTFPINALIHHLTAINAAAVLPGAAAAILVCISMFLTILAGAIPSRLAARKDPVVALRTE